MTTTKRSPEAGDVWKAENGTAYVVHCIATGTGALDLGERMIVYHRENELGVYQVDLECDFMHHFKHAQSRHEVAAQRAERKANHMRGWH